MHDVFTFRQSLDRGITPGFSRVPCCARRAAGCKPCWTPHRDGGIMAGWRAHVALRGFRGRREAWKHCVVSVLREEVDPGRPARPMPRRLFNENTVGLATGTFTGVVPGSVGKDQRAAAGRKREIAFRPPLQRCMPKSGDSHRTAAISGHRAVRDTGRFPLSDCRARGPNPHDSLGVPAW